MESKRQNSLWSWGYKNINSRLFCLRFRGLSWWDSMCVQMSGEHCLMPIKTKTGDTSVSSDHCLVKVCPRGKGGHMCLRKWKRGQCAQTGLVPCRNPPNPTNQTFLIYSYHILHTPHLFVLFPHLLPRFQPSVLQIIHLLGAGQAAHVHFISTACPGIGTLPWLLQCTLNIKISNIYVFIIL